MQIIGRNILEGDSLTSREREVLALLCKGLTARHAGELLHLSTSTIHTYTKCLYIKLGVSSRAEMAVQAMREKLVC